MPTNLNVTVVEESTLVLTVAFFDEDDAPVIPTAASWSLLTRNGVVVNSRQAVSISPLLASVEIVLTGDDLAMLTNADHTRIVQLEAIYDSTAGIGLKLKDAVLFKLTDLVGIT